MKEYVFGKTRSISFGHLSDALTPPPGISSPVTLSSVSSPSTSSPIAAAISESSSPNLSHSASSAPISTPSVAAPSSPSLTHPSSPYSSSPSHSPSLISYSPSSLRERDRDRGDASRTQYTHDQIARELLVVDTEFFRSLSPLEFVGLEWNKANKDLLARNVNGWTDWFNRV